MKVRALLHIASVAIPFIMAACDAAAVTRAADDGSAPEAPESSDDSDMGDASVPPEAAAILIDGPPLVTLSPHETLQLHLTVIDTSGAVLDTDVEPSWSSEVRERVEVGDDGLLRAGDRPGHSWVTGEADDLRDSVAVWIQPPESDPSTFDVTLHYGPGVPAWWPPALEAAVVRWKRAIRAALPTVRVADLPDHCSQVTDQPPELRAGVESGVRIFVRVSDAFPTFGGPRATAGVCANRGLPSPTAAVGIVTLNAFQLGDEPPDDLAYLAHHEIGHALGLVGVVQGEQPGWLGRANGTYQGHLALFGRTLDGDGEPSVLEFDSDGHWLFADLMGTPRAATISHTTIGALMDLGYPAAWYGSGPIEE